MRNGPWEMYLCIESTTLVHVHYTFQSTPIFKVAHPFRPATSRRKRSEQICTHIANHVDTHSRIIEFCGLCSLIQEEDLGGIRSALFDANPIQLPSRMCGAHWKQTTLTTKHVFIAACQWVNIYRRTAQADQKVGTKVWETHCRPSTPQDAT